jgi:hypothetical protein
MGHGIAGGSSQVLLDWGTLWAIMEVHFDHDHRFDMNWGF